MWRRRWNALSPKSLRASWTARTLHLEKIKSKIKKGDKEDLCHLLDEKAILVLQVKTLQGLGHPLTQRGGC